MNYDTYGSSAMELAIDLANADLADPQGVQAFLSSHDEWFTEGTALRLAAAEAAAVAEASALIRDVALADNETDVMARLNALLALASPRPYATDHDGELHLHYAQIGR